MKKRAVSVLLALALCLGLTVFASAEDQSDETPADPFTDVAEDAYYYDAVLWAVDKGITTGKTETTFVPGRDLHHRPHPHLPVACQRFSRAHH